MNNLFITTTDFKIAPGITFPTDGVLGINMYPPDLQNTQLYLKSIELIRSIKHNDYKAVLSIAAGADVVAVCTTDTFAYLKEVQNTEELNDYVLNFINPATGCGCGCMVVLKSFITWLINIPDIPDIPNTALVVNPTYVYNALSTADAYISVNNTKVDKIVFNNVSINDGEFAIVDKVQASADADLPAYMTALNIDGVVLRGKSIGFTIAPNGEHCRVHIQTSDGQISFLDQSVSL